MIYILFLFTIYVKALHVSQLGTREWLVNYEVERFPNLIKYVCTCLEGLRKTMNICVALSRTWSMDLLSTQQICQPFDRSWYILLLLHFIVLLFYHFFVFYLFYFIHMQHKNIVIIDTSISVYLISVYEGFLMEKMALIDVFLRVTRFSPVSYHSAIALHSFTCHQFFVVCKLKMSLNKPVKMFQFLRQLFITRGFLNSVA